MSDPIAFTLRPGSAPAVYPIRLDEAVASRLRGRAVAGGSAILVVSDVAMLDKMAAGVFDANDVQVLANGDWSNALLLVMPRRAAPPPAVEQEPDREFLDRVARQTPELVGLAQKLIGAVRAAGIEGSLRLEGHKWVNRPLNTFTVTVQPRARNFQFTLYGGPGRFGVTDFIKSDQNGYSRGWVKIEADVPKFVELAKIAYDRKPRR
jgi:hypothetical protein